jgi:mono/diheme cytochrome c family protein
MDFAGGSRVSLSEYHEADPTGVPPELKGASLIERGEYLARAADCAACHTAEGGMPYAGGRAFVLPFGTLYSTNITPDKDTGIGNYSDADFLNAVHKGIGRGDTRLYPAMPFASYSYMTDADAGAIKAYLFSLKPVHAPAPANTLSFPFNQRALMGVWAMLFNPDKRFEPRAERNPQWNRGAYLVEAMGHCGECHTPRNLMQALDNRQKFSGAVQAGWRAYNVTSDPKSGIGAWSEADLARYLSVGHAEGRGTATGPMGEAVDNSLQYLSQSDIKAMVSYLRSVPPVATPGLPEPKLAAAPRPTLRVWPPTSTHRARRCMPAPARPAMIGPGSVRFFPLQRSPACDR